jgi:O-antigen/teichoic acid export membrane protein
VQDLTRAPARGAEATATLALSPLGDATLPRGPELRVARATAWNLAGQALPLLVAVVAIPHLVHGLGTDRFGVLSLVWVVIGYFGLFDLGLGRSLTKLVAERRDTAAPQELAALVWTGLLLMLGLGLAGTAVGIALAPWLVHDALKLPAELQAEALAAFYLLAGSIPLVVSAAGLRGVLDAYYQFALANAVRIPLGAFTFVGPLLVLPFSRQLEPVVAVLVAGRLVAWLAHLLLCRRVVPALQQRPRVERGAIGPLLRFGSWLTVSNVVGPLMVYLDRFLIGALLSAAAVAYYTVPYEVVTRLWLLPAALTGVLFPALAASLAADRGRARELFTLGVRWALLALFPCVLAIVTLAPEGLALWLGDAFAAQSARVAQWLAVGVLINSLAQVPFTLVQAAGRPDLTAKLHLLELPLYLVAVVGLVQARGVEGAAIAWTLRVTVDALCLFALAPRFVPHRAADLGRAAGAVGVGGVALGLAALLTEPVTKGLFLLVVLSGFAVVGWRCVLAPAERHRVAALVAGVRYGWG